MSMAERDPRVPKTVRTRVVVGVTAIVAVAFITVFLCVFLISEPLTGPRVDLNYTTYVGSRLDSNISVFRGMRYAAPPVGALRWRAPVEPEYEDKPQRAKTFMPICLSTGAAYPGSGQDEDCLFVNVWAPTDATPESKLPVWVFIQGGGYTANSNANWDGEEVVKRSGNRIVFVNFNYRVGLWGFLASERVRRDGNLNVGLLDQRFLLEWVQKHIYMFGGDPDHVVISGASAGAGSVALHLTAHGGRDRGLFVGGIVMSVFFPAQPRLSRLEWQFDRLAQAVGCGADVSGDDQMACLRGKTTRQLQAANVASAFPGRDRPPPPKFYWTPCVDGDFIPDLPYTLFEQGRFIDVPLIFGTDNDEGTVFSADAATQEEMSVFLQNNYPRLSDADMDGILERYPLMDPLPFHQPWFPSTALAYGEATFICPTVNVLDSVLATRSAASSSASGSPQNASASGLWAYRYNVQDEDNIREGMGVTHTFELAAVFGPGSIGPVRPSYWTYNAPIVPIVMDYWLSFVRALDPNMLKNDAAPEWAQWSGLTTVAAPEADSQTTKRDGDVRENGNRSRLVIETGHTRMEDTPPAQVSRCQFWESLKEVTEQKRNVVQQENEAAATGQKRLRSN